MGIRERFRFLEKKREKDIMRIIVAAKRCLDTPEGEILLDHLIDLYGIDEPSGQLDHDECLYKNARRDVIIYILSLINHKEK